MNQVGGPVICTDGASVSERRSMYRGELRGEFIRLARGHFIGTSVYEDLDEDEKEVVRIAAHACCAPTTLVVGRSAALLWELPVVDEPEKRATRKVELGAVGGRTSSSGALRYRSLHRVHEDGAETTDTDFGSLRLTDVLTTALDLARWSSLRDSVRSLDLGLQTGQFTFADMDTRVAEMAGVKGDQQYPAGCPAGLRGFREPRGDRRQTAVPGTRDPPAPATGGADRAAGQQDREGRLLLP